MTTLRERLGREPKSSEVGSVRNEALRQAEKFERVVDEMLGASHSVPHLASEADKQVAPEQAAQDEWRHENTENIALVLECIEILRAAEGELETLDYEWFSRTCADLLASLERARNDHEL